MMVTTTLLLSIFLNSILSQMEYSTWNIQRKVRWFSEYKTESMCMYQSSHNHNILSSPEFKFIDAAS